MTRLYGGIEAGGTKFVCGVGTTPEDIEEIRFPTTTPVETLTKAREFFRSFEGRLDALGIGTFGPIELHKGASSYGHITTTPKPLWSHTDFVGSLKTDFELPIGFDTDVNAAALGEARWGAAKGQSDVVYITIGTGVGGGVLSGGKLVHGLVHPEVGHIFLRKHPQDTFKGNCPFHGDACFEGLCSGPAMQARWGVPADQLPEDHQAWEFQSYYIAQAMAAIICMLSPQKIILGGGVMGQAHLLERVRRKTVEFLNGYVSHPSVLEDIDNYIVSPGLGNRAGLLGAIVLAMDADKRL